MSDRIGIMNRGRIAQIGTPADVYERPRTRFTATFVGETNLFERSGNGNEASDPGRGREALAVIHSELRDDFSRTPCQTQPRSDEH